MSKYWWMVPSRYNAVRMQANKTVIETALFISKSVSTQTIGLPYILPVASSIRKLKKVGESNNSTENAEKAVCDSLIMDAAIFLVLQISL